MATSRILGPDGQPIQLDVLREEVSAPSTTGIRQVWHGSVANNLTPQRLSRILHQAAEGDAHAYLTLAEEMEERDMHYGSVLGTRKQAVVGLDVQIEAASDDADDVRRADAVRALIDQPEFGEMVSHLTDALGKSYAVSEIVWDRSGREWQPTYEERDPRWFRFDRDSGRELRLLDERDTSEGLPLPPFKFLVHLPRIRSGLPIRGGLARLAAPSYMCKAWSWKDWMAFADIFGLPMRVGRYGPNTPQEDINKLINAIANLGSDAAAVVPDSVKIEFNQASQVGGAGDFFEKLATFWDKQISKGVLGQTMTADDGASLSQAKVHNDVRMDLLEADAKAMSNTLQRMLVVPFCTLNFGAQFKPPRLRIVVPEPDNTAQLVDAVSKLVPVGFRVEQSVIRDKLGLPDPAKDAEVFVPPAAPMPGAPGAMPWATPPPWSPPVPIAPPEAATPPSVSQDGPPASVDVQAEALNGAQVKSMLDLLSTASRKELPLDTVRAMIKVAFPLVTDEQLSAMIQPLIQFQPPQASPATPSAAAQIEAPPARASNAEQGGVGDPVDIGAAALADAVDPLVATWVEVLAEMAAEAGDFETLRERLDGRAEALSLDLIARQLAQGMAVARLAGRADIADLVEADAAEGEGRARNAETLGAGVINRGWEPAAQFFMRKLNVPTARWNDLWQGEQSRAFTVAGAMRADLLQDLREAVAAAVQGGESYDQFRDRFEEIVARRGWTGWTGEGSEKGRAWRTRVIYQTNLSTSHAAGRYAQMTEPETLAQLPYWQYRHNSVANPREEHKAWDGLILRADDPWWQTHYPPNGWMCRCDVRPVSERMLRRAGKSGPDQAPPPGRGDPPPEWAYNVGAAGARGG